MGKSGTFVYDPKNRCMVQISDKIPGIASRVNVQGENVFCDPNGETLDFGKGPQVVSSASEKRKVLREHGVMPHPGGNYGKDRKIDTSKIPSFAEHFRREQGIPLSEAKDLVHVRER